MTRQKWILMLVALMLIGGTAGLLAHVRSFQTLGKPGVKTQPLAGSQNLEVLLPENVPGYTSKKMETQQIVIDTLPKDTSFGQCVYEAPNKFACQTSVVLMGADRTSIHKPQFCLTGGGWTINSTTIESVAMERPQPYPLKVIKLLCSRPTDNGTLRGIYVYWFVAEDALSADPVGLKRMGVSAWDLLRTGVLKRWAYVSYFSACLPGQEDATFEQMKKLLAASVPNFQLVSAPEAKP